MADVVTDDRAPRGRGYPGLVRGRPTSGVGAEHEVRLPPAGTSRSHAGPAVIQALLNGMTRFGWKGVYENIIALERGGQCQP